MVWDTRLAGRIGAGLNGTCLKTNVGSILRGMV
jgi:hypothetical protein